MKSFWDERYSSAGYFYGEQPNAYLKAQLPGYPPGSILFPAEGEGRNAVFAATLGWKVSAFDQSTEGQKKALQLAQKHQGNIDYTVGEFQDVRYAPGQFDAIALIYAHFDANLKPAYHKMLDTYLKPGGIIIFEAYSKKHLAYNMVNERAGGPRDIGMLYSTDEIMTDFNNYDILELTELVIEQDEGLYHFGKGWVIRFKGRKR